MKSYKYSNFPLVPDVNMALCSVSSFLPPLVPISMKEQNNKIGLVPVAEQWKPTDKSEKSYRDFHDLFRINESKDCDATESSSTVRYVFLQMLNNFILF